MSLIIVDFQVTVHIPVWWLRHCVWPLPTCLHHVLLCPYPFFHILNLSRTTFRIWMHHAVLYLKGFCSSFSLCLEWLSFSTQEILSFSIFFVNPFLSIPFMGPLLHLIKFYYNAMPPNSPGLGLSPGPEEL